MFAYYLALALRGMRRSRVLTGLMVLALGLGIGACMTTLTVYRVMSGDPIPSKSHRLFTPQLDSDPMKGYTPDDELPEQMTRFDAEALLREHHGVQQAVMTGGGFSIVPDQPDLLPFFVDSRYTSADFFSMFDAPFEAGQGWTAADDEARARVAVITTELAEKVFGKQPAVGRDIRIDEQVYRVVGVLKPWQLTPHFYDLNTSRFGNTEQVYVPFSTSRELKLSRNGSMTCHSEKSADPTALASMCTWVQYWVQLDTAQQVSDYRQYLQGYAERQHAAGRFERPARTALHDVMGWMTLKKVVPSDAELQVGVAFAFLLLCLVNTIGLLLAKCLRRAPEIGVRRALGASRRSIFLQFLVEAGVIGLLGGALGLLLSIGGLALVRQSPSGVAKLAELDMTMLALNFGLGLAASVLAGLLPAWRACQITPALQLKSS
ncbi:ABC transporter permease [Ideonella azotifigens]|uniref:ABC transporter permease n=1 Tax=Ideonella azotifigens TaxID=513160 RepID=A0ABN1JI81_9BURK|nr:ABC transporter permease [Ideonella azotifigens]MCD2343524.1 ABC transporter permease [Ideonella azotifigens]